MCGRFYVDDDLKEELDSLLSELNAKKRNVTNYKIGEVCPSDHAVVLTKERKHAEVAKWGYPSWKGKNVIFNARSETALQKRMFERGFVTNRCLVPVRGFFEWNSEKKKYYFAGEARETLYLGGIMDEFDGIRCFSILTREADNEMKKVHSRMPVIISEDKMDLWLGSLESAKTFVYMSQIILNPEPIEKDAKNNTAEYEQIHIFNTIDV